MGRGTAHGADGRIDAPEAFQVEKVVALCFDTKVRIPGKKADGADPSGRRFSWGDGVHVELELVDSQEKPSRDILFDEDDINPVLKV